jgi:hypothetical protein
LHGVVTLLKEEHENFTPRILSTDSNCLAPTVTAAAQRIGAFFAPESGSARLRSRLLKFEIVEALDG